MIEPGIYSARGVEGSAQLGVADTGTEQVAIELMLENGETYTTVLSFTDAAEQMSIDRLKALGWTGSHQPHLFAGVGNNDVQVLVKHDEYNGKVRVKVDVLTGGRFQFKNTMDEAQKRNFLGRLSASLGAGGSGPATPRAPAAQGAQRPAPQRQAQGRAPNGRPPAHVQGPPPGRFDDDAPIDDDF